MYIYNYQRGFIKFAYTTEGWQCSGHLHASEPENLELLSPRSWRTQNKGV
jgi:hypothetical protein